MEATTSAISKEELLAKIEEAKKRLEDAPYFDGRYLIDEALLNGLFEIGYNGISIGWLKKLQNKYAEQECWMSYGIINEIINLWRSGYEPG